MLLIVLKKMTVAVSVVFNLLAKLEEIDILGVRNIFKNYYVSSQGEVEW